jgi:hypothetical protein
LIPSIPRIPGGWLRTTNGNPLSEHRCSQQDGDYVPHF